MRYVSMLYAITLGVPVFSSAQTLGNPEGLVRPGSRVRILSPVFGDRSQTATVVSSSPESLVFRLNAQSPSQTLNTSAITSMDVSAGTRAHKMTGSLIGFAAGAALGGIVGYATWQKPTCKNAQLGCIAFDFGRGGDAAFAGGLGGIVGAIAGLVVGSRQSEVWVPVASTQSANTGH
jgi:hypothetical protein